MPLRKMDFISRVLALAEPVPFTVAILIAKSLVLSMGYQVSELDRYALLGIFAALAAASSSACGHFTKDFCMSHAAVGQRSAHSPQCTQRSSSLTITRPVCFRAEDTYKA